MTKRAFDLVSASLSLLALLPLFALFSVAIVLESPGPVFYRGARVGRGGEPFRIFKFRTMIRDADRKGPSSTAEGDLRLTQVGRLLRKFKLDELPQLLNVVLGDMSLVGPRPQVPWAVDLYSPEERRLLDVRPGITDFASLQFHNEGELLRGYEDPDQTYLELIAPEKIRLGLYYVDNRNLWMDFRLIVMTVTRVFRGAGR